MQKQFLLVFLFIASLSGIDAQNINICNNNGPMGIQVNTLTGNLFLPRADIYIPARSIDMDITFYYNSFNYNQNIDFGNGWSFNYSTLYSVDTAGNVTITWGDARQETYNLNGDGSFTAPVGIFNTLTQYQVGKYLLTTKYGVQYYFDNNAVKRLTKIQDANSNYLNFNYIDTLLSSMTNAAGQTISFNYTSGLLSSIVDAIASPTRVYAYQYDGYGNLTEVTDPIGGKFKYQYLVNGPMSEITDKNSNVADIIYNSDFTVSELISCDNRKSFSYDTTSLTSTVTDYVPTSSNQTTTYYYAKYNNLAWLTKLVGNCCGYTKSFNFDGNGNMVSMIDANGNVYKYNYDTKGNLITQADPLKNTSSFTYSSDFNQVTSYTDAKGNNYTCQYDANGNPVQFTRPGNIVSTAANSVFGDVTSITDANGNKFNVAYDAFGNPIQISGPLGFSGNMQFDARGNELSVKDPNGNTYNASYDSLNRIVSIADPFNHTFHIAYDHNDNITSIVNQKGQVTRFAYDASDRLVNVTDAVGKQSFYVYDAVSNLIKFTDKNSNSTSFNYDNLNRLSSVVDALGNTYTFTYDANGNRVSATLPNGNTINTTFDNLNRVVSATDALGTIGSITYDANGNLAGYINGTGALVSASYDALDRLISVADPLGNSKKFSYDNNSNLTSITDRNNHISSYVFDALNRITGITDNNGLVISGSYDAASNLQTLTDQNNHNTSYTYDAMNRVISETYSDGKSISFTYDNMGNVVSKQLPDGSVVTLQYDSLNRPVSKILPGNNSSAYSYDAESKLTSATNSNGTVTLSYDALNRLALETYNNHSVNYSYNDATGTVKVNYPDSSAILQNFDKRGRMLSLLKNNTKLVSYQYNNSNQLLQSDFSNGVISNWQYDATNRLSSISTSNGNIQSSSFTYDNESNKIAVAKTNPSQLSEQYGYDADYRITNFTQGLIQNSYTYDNAGNRIMVSLNGVNTSYSVNNLNQYTNLNNNGQHINYIYDNNGNLVFDNNFYKTYDAEGKLILDSSVSNKLSYKYDALGRRVQKTVNGRAINYYYGGLLQLEQRDAVSDTVLNETIYSGILNPVAFSSNHANYFFHQNDLRSVEAVTDSSGNLVERYQYDVYGKPAIYDASNNLLTVSKVGNRFEFTGQEFDNETGNYNFHFRNYSPVTGNFNQRDPIGYNDGTNIYQYVHDNPVNNVDILGLESDPCIHRPGFVKLITSKYWRDEINRMRALKNEKDKKGEWWNTQAITFDSKFYRQLPAEIEGNAEFYLNGHTYQNYELNYYFQGMFFKASGMSEYTMDNFVTGWRTFKNGLKSIDEFGNGQNAFADPNLGTYTSQQSYDMAALGYEETPDQMFTCHNGEFVQNDVPQLPSMPTSEYEVKIVPGGQFWPTINPTTGERGYEFFRDRNWNPGGKTPCPPNKPGGTQKKTPPGPGNPGNTGKTNLLGAHDPNLIVGPVGVGTPKWVSISAPMPYTIFYENSPSANAPARIVRINYPIDPKQDPNSFSLGSFGFNNLTFNVPPNTASYYQRLDVRDSLGLYVDVTAGLDVVNHQIFWTFESIDPATLLPPSDPTKGFLLISDSTNSSAGHGFVNFTIKPLQTDVTGDTTHAIGSIVFDYNDTIPTNYTKNTIDAVAPTSQITPLQAISTTRKISLSWSGSDDLGGSGLQSYTLYVSSNGGTSYTVLATGMTSTDTTFTGANNGSYSFFVLATDSAGNTEVLRPGATTSIFIDVQAILPVTWLYFNASNQGNNNLLSWATGTEVNTKEFEIERSVDGINFTSLGTVSASGNSNVQTNYNYLDKNVTDLDFTTVYYRLKQIGNDGKYTYSNIIAVQIPTILPVVKVYPNPFKQLLNLMIGNISTISKDDNATLYTAEGKLLYQHKLGNRLLNQFITLSDLPQLASGTYILKLTLNHHQYSFTIIRQ